MLDPFGWFGSSPYVAAIANGIQIASTIFAIWAWRHIRCKVPWCVRPGQHEVQDTSWKVCSVHHKREHHDRLRLIHREKHPDRMSHGDSR